MITTATTAMIPALKALWKEAFGDPDEYTDFFFSQGFRPDRTFLYLQEARPVSMAFVFPGELCVHDSYIPVGYIYGVATYKDSRGKGYSTQVLQFIQQQYPVTFLVPSTKSLFQFYARNGYHTAFHVNEIIYHLDQLAEPIAPITMQDITPEEYKIVRDQYFHGTGYLRWDESTIAYALAENIICNGSAIKVRNLLEHSLHYQPRSIVDKADSKTPLADYPEAILMYRCYKQELIIKETTLSGKLLQDTAYRLMEKTKTNICRIRLRPDSSSPGKAFAMLHGQGGLTSGYCNLVLD